MRFRDIFYILKLQLMSQIWKYLVNGHLADQPANCKRGGVCIFYKCTLLLRVLNISNLNECINFEVSIANKIFHFIICIDLLIKHKMDFKYSGQI